MGTDEVQLTVDLWKVGVSEWLSFCYGYGMAWFAFVGERFKGPQGQEAKSVEKVAVFLLSPFWVPVWLVTRLFS